MNNNRPNRAVRLLHLPKTAGTTFASSLVRHFGRDRSHAIWAEYNRSIRDYESLSAKKRQSIRLFIGHSNYDTGIPAADEACVITVLREPISRVKSFIRFATSGKTGMSKHMGGSGFTVDEILESGSTEISNLQVKHLSNRQGVDWDVGLAELGGDAAVSLARERLFHKIHAFGVQDYFDETWVAIWNSLGIKPPVYATKNRGKQHFEFTTGQEEKIRELNQLDIALYTAAKAEFEHRLRNGAYPPEVFDDFMRRQKRLGPLVTAVRNTTSQLYWSYRRNRKKLLGRISG